jgi:pantothenate kinase
MQTAAVALLQWQDTKLHASMAGGKFTIFCVEYQTAVDFAVQKNSQIQQLDSGAFFLCIHGYSGIMGIGTPP